MGELFYLAGIALAGVAGYSGLEWYFIFISSFVIAIGYFIIRAPTILGVASRDGKIYIPKIMAYVTIIMSLLTTPVYFVAALLS